MTKERQDSDGSNTGSLASTPESLFSVTLSSKDTSANNSPQGSPPLTPRTPQRSIKRGYKPSPKTIDRRDRNGQKLPAAKRKLWSIFSCCRNKGNKKGTEKDPLIGKDIEKIDIRLI